MTDWPAGVTALDHTADVGIRVRAQSLERLFDRAARGMLALIAGREEASAAEPERVDRGRDEDGAASVGATRHIALDAEDEQTLLVAWLRELLFLAQVRGFAYAGARFARLEAGRLEAEVRGVEPPTPEMELKGVTYHGLAVEEDEDGWAATVIFDV